MIYRVFPNSDSVVACDNNGGAEIVPPTDAGYVAFLAQGGVLSPAISPLPNFMADLRAKRDSLLSQSDWIMLADSPATTDKKASWATYRQALRDLPANTPDPSNVVWPTVPS